jgi:hypothetical protein
MLGARTSTLDSKTNRVITMESETAPPPAPAPGAPAPGSRGGGRGQVVPGSFSIVVVGKLGTDRSMRNCFPDVQKMVAELHLFEHTWFAVERSRDSQDFCRPWKVAKSDKKSGVDAPLARHRNTSYTLQPVRFCPSADGAHLLQD